MSESENRSPFWRQLIRQISQKLTERLPAWMVASRLRSLTRYLLVFTSLITAFSFVFHVLMALEGRHYSIVDSLYWTLTTMSTLGYGDITFTSDYGRLFSIVVLLSGIIVLLVLLPVTFVELFYEPWMEARAASRLPRKISDKIKDHIILTNYGALATVLIEKLKQYKYPYVVILPDAEEVKLLHDAGVKVIHGDFSDPETFINAGVSRAALVATTRNDIANTTVVFTVRGISEDIPIIATARDNTSVPILKLAGCKRVLNLTELMAGALARRVAGGKNFTHIIGKIDDLLIAEVNASQTTLVGKPYLQAQFETSVSIVGFWDRGRFEIGQEHSTVNANTALVLAGSRQQLKEFDQKYQVQEANSPRGPVIIIGGGRVGRATGGELARRGIDYRIIEKDKSRVVDSSVTIIGSGADSEIMTQADIENASAVIITTRDDETNIYLAIFCRLLRDNVQIISRATLERSVAPLHRAGADLVMSYASMGANSLFNLMQRSDLLMVAEGLDVYKVPVPGELAGKTLIEANIRQQTNCTVIGIDTKDKTTTNPSPESILPEEGEIVLIGTPESETAFLKLFTSKK
jgi:voltage-gated potassium channel